MKNRLMIHLYELIKWGFYCRNRFSLFDRCLLSEGNNEVIFQVEDVWVVKRKDTKEPKGIAYVKFSKASEAALAMEKLHGSTIGDNPKPIKVHTTHLYLSLSFDMRFLMFIKICVTTHLIWIKEYIRVIQVVKAVLMFKQILFSWQNVACYYTELANFSAHWFCYCS